jgi:hypothetical protein
MEKISICVTGYGEGQPRVYLPNEIIEDPLAMETELNIDINPTHHTKKREATVSLDYGKYILRLRQEYQNGAKWKLQHATINLARIRYGHNAKLILTDDDLQLALTIANQTLNKCVSPGGDDLIIPGVLEESCSYCNYLEIANQVHDPNSALIKKMKHARLMYYNSDHFKYEDMKTSGKAESLYIGNDDKPIICGYRKDVEITQRRKKDFDGEQSEPWFVSDTHTECLRIEARLHGRKMINTILDQREAYEDGVRLRSFGVNDVYKAYERVLSNLRGVFRDPSGSYDHPKRFKAATAEVIEMISKGPDDAPLHELLREYQKAHDCGDSTIRAIRSNVEVWLSSISTVSLDQIIPLLGNCTPMQIEPMKKTKEGKLVPVFRGAHQPQSIDPRIAEAYSGGISTLNIHDIPSLDLPWMHKR